MINLKIVTPRLFGILFFIFSAMFLQGCGAERSYPYGSLPCSSSSSSANSGNASSCYTNISYSSSSSSSTSSSSSSSSSSLFSGPPALSKSLQNVIETIPNASGISPVNPVSYSGKVLQVISTEAELNALSTVYLNHKFDKEDFDVAKLAIGRVVLIDEGSPDNCTSPQTSISGISAEDISDTALRIIVNRKIAATNETCSASPPRPFQFFYVRSQKALIFDERTSP
jgi:hypothetical protein